MFECALRPALVAAFVGMASLGLAHADEGSVRKAVEGFVGSPVVESVARMPYGGLYEVVLKSGEIVYTDEKVSFLIDGRVIDTKTRRDVTQARMTQLSAIDFGTLPLDQAIKQVKGNGKRVIVSFEDPNCGYCKRLGKELAQLKDVTVYTFLYPILSPDSTEKSRHIWCAEDRAKAWSDWILNAKVPASASCDSSVVERNVTLGQKLRINGTPTMFLADGRRLGGYLPAAELEQALLEVGKK
ncbi:DsbC family protein [Aromatoleum anaerobium]|uniref:Thiol:disulfide interchange protein n=1 Tax=Aromatoleum anaerobium TaxID=182180 RepID=A0ABX1PRZ6_9RHOO|nr:DsbC family protein [Aromatoleum anaerobium]MCK0509504.1 DsbC family protein [Aromatoleum anaerobium]